MPIECPISFPRLKREAFRELDFRVMKRAFETHGALGRNCEEEIYHHELAGRLDADGFAPSQVEVPIRVRHGSFLKEYRIDLVVATQAIYELKAVRTLLSAHEGQTMNYLLLTDCEHGKVVNFGGPSVASRFVNNPLTRDERYRFKMVMQDWSGPESLRSALVNLIEDIGLFLESSLYNQALVHHYGPENALVRRPMVLGGRQLGNQSFQLSAPDEAFRVTTLSQRNRAQRTSLEKLLVLGNLKALHWINLNHHQVELTTLTR